MNIFDNRFALDDNDAILDFESSSNRYDLTQKEVCDLLNKQHKEILELKKNVKRFELMCGDNRIMSNLFKKYKKKVNV